MSYDGSVKFDTKIDSSGLKKAMNDIKSSLADAGIYFKSLGKSGEDAFKQLSAQLNKIDAEAAITGDTIGALARKKEVLKNEIQKLIASGLKPESLEVQALTKVVNNLTTAETQMGTVAVKQSKTLKETFASIRDFMQGPVAAGKMIIDVFKKIGQVADQLENAWAAQEEAIALLDATLKSTGADAWTSSKRLQEMASSLQQVTKFGDETITSMQTVLLGFRNITGENFEKATVEILNMATVMKMDLTSAAQAVGKALDNPAQGMDSLSRQGFKFTQQEKDMMKAMQDAGDIAGAQKIILDELAKTYGGAAEAAGATGSAMKVKLQNAVGDLNEELGRSITESGPVSNFRKNVAAIAAEWANVLKASNDYKEWLKKQKSGVETTETENIDALTYRLEQLRKDRETALSSGMRNASEVIKWIDEEIASKEKQIKAEENLREKKAALAQANEAQRKAAEAEVAKAEAEIKKNDELATARNKAYGEQADALARLKYEYEQGIITEEEFLTGQLEAAEKLVQAFVDIKMEFGDAFGPANVEAHLTPAIELVEALNAAIDEVRAKLGALGYRPTPPSPTPSDYVPEERQRTDVEVLISTYQKLRGAMSAGGDLLGFLDAEELRKVEDVASGLVDTFYDLADAMNQSLATNDFSTFIASFRDMVEQFRAEMPKMLAMAGLQAIIGGNMPLGIALLAAGGITLVGAGLTALTKWLNETIFGTGDALGGMEFGGDLDKMGQSIGSKLADSLFQGFSGEDFAYEIEEFIRKGLIEGVVNSAGIQSALGKVNAMIADGIQEGELQGIAGIISDVYSSASSQAALIDSLITGALTGDLSQNVSLSSDMSKSMTANVNLTANSNVSIDGETVARAVTKYQDRVYSNAYGA